MDMKEAIARALPTAPLATWLVFMPASGSVTRWKGFLLALDMGGTVKQVPVIVEENLQVTILDARSLIVNDQTLTIIWHPREHDIDNNLAKWFRDNPDVFATKSGPLVPKLIGKLP